MNRVFTLVEGDTEQQFVKQVLAPMLGMQGVFLTVRKIGKPGHRGGMRSWGLLRKEISSTLKQDTGCLCTTLFDYYGLPHDCPSLNEAKTMPPRDGVALLEKGMHQAIRAAIGEGLDPNRFIPYIQLHEFEALLFSDTRILAKTVQNPGLCDVFNNIIELCGEPELIDDHPETAPSKRLLLATNQRYQKVLHGILAAKEIGLDRIREKCPHFGEWLHRLERLGTAEIDPS